MITQKCSEKNYTTVSTNYPWILKKHSLILLSFRPTIRKRLETVPVGVGAATTTSPQVVRVTASSETRAAPTRCAPLRSPCSTQTSTSEPSRLPPALPQRSSQSSRSLPRFQSPDAPSRRTASTSTTSVSSPRP